MALGQFGEESLRALRNDDVPLGKVLRRLLEESENDDAPHSRELARDWLQKLWSEEKKDSIRAAVGRDIELDLKAACEPGYRSLENRETARNSVRRTVRALRSQSLPIMLDLYERWQESEERWSSGYDSEFMPESASTLMCGAIRDVTGAAIPERGARPSPLPPLDQAERAEVAKRIEEASYHGWRI